MVVNVVQSTFNERGEPLSAQSWFGRGIFEDLTQSLRIFDETDIYWLSAPSSPQIDQPDLGGPAADEADGRHSASAESLVDATLQSKRAGEELRVWCLWNNSKVPLRVEYTQGQGTFDAALAPSAGHYRAQNHLEQVQWCRDMIQISYYDLSLDCPEHKTVEPQMVPFRTGSGGRTGEEYGIGDLSAASAAVVDTIEALSAAGPVSKSQLIPAVVSAVEREMLKRVLLPGRFSATGLPQVGVRCGVSLLPGS